MHILMISLDTSILTKTIGDSRPRHEKYAEMFGRISLVVCNRRRRSPLPTYKSERVVARPTESRSFLHYLWNGYRTGLRFHSEQPVDLISSQDPFLTAMIGLALRWKIGVPLLIQIHSPMLDNEHFAAESRRNVWLQKLARWTVKRADAVRVVSQSEREACIRLGVAGDHVCVIPVPANVRRFMMPASTDQITEWWNRLVIDPDAPLILWVGRPVAFKDLPTLLRAFVRVHEDIPNAYLVIAGDIQGTDIPAQVKRTGLAEFILMPGPVAHDDLPALYQIATIYAHSSYYEGFGLVMVEAGASGLPVVATDTVGAREIIVDGDTGRLVPVRDDKALASALVELLNDPDQASAMGERARQRVQQLFDQNRTAEKWVNMWRAVAARDLFPCGS